MPLTRRASLLGLTGVVGVAGIGGIPGVPPAAARAIDAVAAYEAATGGHVGFHAVNAGTGATLGWRRDERFVMCSTFKASLAALVLHRVERGAERLDRPVAISAAEIPDWYAPVARASLARGSLTVGDMCRAAVEQSDNTCATLLLDGVGGPPALTAFWRACGDRTSRLDDPEPILNRTPFGSDRDTTTPRAMATTVGRFVLGHVLAAPSRRHFARWLVGSVTGFDRLRAGLPPGWTVGDNTGNNGADAAGDVAVAWSPGGSPIVICAYTRGGRPDEAQRRALFRGVANVVAARLA